MVEAHVIFHYGGVLVLITRMVLGGKYFRDSVIILGDLAVLVVSR